MRPSWPPAPGACLPGLARGRFTYLTLASAVHSQPGLRRFGFSQLALSHTEHGAL